MKALLEFGLVISNTKQIVRLYAPIEFVSEKLYLIDVSHEDKFKFFYGVDTIVDLTNRCFIKQINNDVSHHPEIDDNTFWSFKMVPLISLEEFFNLIPNR